MSINNVFDRGDRVEFWGPGCVMTLTGEDADTVRGWVREAKKHEWTVKNYVQYMAEMEGWI